MYVHFFKKLKNTNFLIITDTALCFAIPGIPRKWLIMETLLTTPEKKRNIRSANNDLFLPYIFLYNPNSPVNFLPVAAALKLIKLHH